MIRGRITKTLTYAVTIAFVGVLISGIFVQQPVHAQEMTSRSLTLEAGATAGGSDPGGVVNHLFNFTIPSTTAISSIEFQYCTVADGTCGDLVTNDGLVLTNATIGTGTSSVLSNFTTISTATADSVILSSSTAYTPSASNTALAVELDSITNPTPANFTFYVRISTWSGTGATGTEIDSGVVAASTANPIVLTGTMPESLIFCTGATVSETAGVPDCTTATAGNVSFAQLFSPTSTATATNQMAASTNANHGYAITVNGSTLSSGGSNPITAITSAATSQIGTTQFGMNLMANTVPVVGTSITPASDGVNYRANPDTGYGTVNSFQFNSGDTVATSSYTALGPTDAQIYTVSYIVNVQGDQPPGTYTTTLTYICTATF